MLWSAHCRLDTRLTVRIDGERVAPWLTVIAQHQQTGVKSLVSPTFYFCGLEYLEYCVVLWLEKWVSIYEHLVLLLLFCFFSEDLVLFPAPHGGSQLSFRIHLLSVASQSRVRNPESSLHARILKFVGLVQATTAAVSSGVDGAATSRRHYFTPSSASSKLPAPFL